MSEHSAHDVDKHVGIYKKVFYTLVVLTVVTVSCSYLKVPIWIGVFIGLAIAAIKGSLVGAFFMHLAWEKKMIYYVMLMTAFFFVAMMGLILWHAADVPHV